MFVRAPSVESVPSFRDIDSAQKIANAIPAFPRFVKDKAGSAPYKFAREAFPDEFRRLLDQQKAGLSVEIDAAVDRALKNTDLLMTDKQILDRIFDSSKPPLKPFSIAHELDQLCCASNTAYHQRRGLEVLNKAQTTLTKNIEARESSSIAKMFLDSRVNQTSTLWRKMTEPFVRAVKYLGWVDEAFVIRDAQSLYEQNEPLFDHLANELFSEIDGLEVLCEKRGIDHKELLKQCETLAVGFDPDEDALPKSETSE